MDGNTQTARIAAQEITSVDDDEMLQRELIFNGIYETIVEGGFHTQALTDNEADFLAMQIVKGGLNQLAEIAEN